MNRKARVAVVVYRTVNKYKEYDPSAYCWNSFILAFEQEGFECYCVGETYLDNSYEELLDFDIVILETLFSYSSFMEPLLRRDLPDRPIVLTFETSTSMFAAWPEWEEKERYFSWIEKADYVSPWTPHSLITYIPKELLKIHIPVPLLYRKELERNRSTERKEYLTSPLYHRGPTDFNIYILKQLGLLTNRKVIYPVQIAHDNNYWTNIIDTIYPCSLSLDAQCKLFSEAFCGVKHWPTNIGIGGRISYMMAKLGTPLVSSPSLTQDILFPKLIIDQYSGLKGILEMLEKLEDIKFYNEVTEYALSQCPIIEQGGPDWPVLINKIKEHAGGYK